MNYASRIPDSMVESFISMEAKKGGDGREKEKERESLVISISILSTACAVRQPVCPNKQPAEGGCLIITSTLFSHPEFTFLLTINTGPGPWPCPLSPLEFRVVSAAAGKATFHMLFRTRTRETSTVTAQGDVPGNGPK